MSGEWETFDTLNWEDWDTQNWDNQIDNSISLSGLSSIGLASTMTMWNSSSYQITASFGAVGLNNQEYIAEQDFEADDYRSFDRWEFVTYNFELDP